MVDNQKKLAPTRPPPPPNTRDELQARIVMSRRFANQLWMCGKPESPRAIGAIAAAHLLILSLLLALPEDELSAETIHELSEIQAVYKLPNAQITLQTYEARCAQHLASLPSEQLPSIFNSAARLCEDLRDKTDHRSPLVAVTLRRLADQCTPESTRVPTRDVLNTLYEALTKDLSGVT